MEQEYAFMKRRIRNPFPGKEWVLFSLFSEKPYKSNSHLQIRICCNVKNTKLHDIAILSGLPFFFEVYYYNL
jgi:hypothetical protein